MAGKLRVEVVYARAELQDCVSLDLAEGAVARDAVDASGLIERYGLPAGPVLGIAGRRAAPERRLRDGDRVEILRNLAAEPKEARRLRARSVRRRRARV
jgi:putative ubiquitin-RnfH superfamily antitoxin RatB of RatAB toxin-antitoxin module